MCEAGGGRNHVPQTLTGQSAFTPGHRSYDWPQMISPRPSPLAPTPPTPTARRMAQDDKSGSARTHPVRLELTPHPPY